MVYDSIFKVKHFQEKKSQKVKIQKLLAYKFAPFFSILTKCIGEKSIAKKKFISVCSPFDSASNHVLDIF